ncbi:cytochrome ubiquinol oxidase subunit I [Microlunatus capsulatus]|uniref:Cytochrome d ubiquinol oxidase subunit I n=1 Tax=Microlunatus capsulatus TaxID=99117 RepID=A0ABS4ZAG2_9ACTN|nr:cytochrome ubiquinol oxidase subunit I [Microlunatus capsulatus]MBP2417223.1 cytochrome d ubiquinol oxidase subunit I [Microlunatus capsulatus]
MSAETLARWQFAITTVYHFFFVPLTISLATLVAGLQTAWVRTGSDRYLRLTKFFGKLFLINFALGVVTGIVQEFQFGMNWSEYSRFVGDVFGAPLALEGLLAFFLESTFLGLWIFGWDRLPRRVHLMTIWVAAIGTILSAYFILAANSFMQNPVGFTFNPERGRAELTDFGAVLSNPVVLVTFPHQIFGCFMVGGAFVAAVAGYHLWKSAQNPSPEPTPLHEPGTSLTEPTSSRPEPGTSLPEPVEGRPSAGSRHGGHEGHGAAWRTALKVGVITLVVAGIGVAITGDLQGKVMTQVQPMKMAAAEALYETEAPASFSVITIGTPDGQRELWSIKVPRLLSFLSTGTLDGEVQGIRELQAAYEATYGPGSYAPNIPLTYWTFRWMIALGMAGAAVGAVVLWATRGGRTLRHRLWLPVLVALPLMPLFANSLGWVFTETGRQPWLVFGLLPTAAGVSPGTTVTEVLISMGTFTALYSVLAVIEVRLMLRTLRAGLPEVAPHPSADADDDLDAPLAFAY